MTHATLQSDLQALPMHSTRIDLPLEARKELVPLLNARLADTLDLIAQAKQAHWNVRGASFIALHELFDQVSETFRDAADELAERAVQLGGTAVGTLGPVARSSQLPDYPLDAVGGTAHVSALADALAAAGAGMRTAIDAAGAQGDADTEDLLTGISRDLDKYLWMVEAHLAD